MSQERYTVISTFAKDLVSQAGSEQIRERPGGPALWIERTLKDLKACYVIEAPKTPARVRIFVTQGGERGKIISFGKIRGLENNISDAFIISTVGNEFELENIKNLKGFIALDAQGYIRMAKNLLRFPKGVADRIDLLKVNKQEEKKLPPSFLSRQKKKLLIVSKGEGGFDVFSRGELYHFSGIRLKGSDTIGAGDVLLTAFVVGLQRGGSVQGAGEFAKDYVTKFLQKGKSA